MFGLGTGVARFRGFLQHREMLLKEGKKVGPATLFVGFRHEANDFFLNQNYEEWMKHGVLSDVHPAFSHDNIEERGFYFIPDLMADQPEDVLRALKPKCGESKESHSVDMFYCGPALGIPEMIEKAMAAAVSKAAPVAGMDENDIKTILDNIAQQEDRFHAECF